MEGSALYKSGESGGALRIPLACGSLNSAEHSLSEKQ